MFPSRLFLSTSAFFFPPLAVSLHDVSAAFSSGVCPDLLSADPDAGLSPAVGQLLFSESFTVTLAGRGHRQVLALATRSVSLSRHPSQTRGVGSSPASGFLWLENEVEETPLIFGVLGQKGQPRLPTLPPAGPQAQPVSPAGGWVLGPSLGILLCTTASHESIGPHSASPWRRAPFLFLSSALWGAVVPERTGRASPPPAPASPSSFRLPVSVRLGLRSSAPFLGGC